MHPLLRKILGLRAPVVNREIKIHLYRKQQTSDSNWEFLRIENKPDKKQSRTIIMVKTGVKLLKLCGSNQE